MNPSLSCGVLATLFLIGLLGPLVHTASTTPKGNYNKNLKLADEATLQYRIDESSKRAFFALTVTDPNIIKDGEMTYLGLGIGRESTEVMLGSDIVTAEFQSGQANDVKCDMKDRYTPLLDGDSGPEGTFPPEDFCESNWVLVNCARDVENGVLVLEVSRGLERGDTQDREIVSGLQHVMFAYGNAFEYHRNRRKAVKVALFGKEEVVESDDANFGEKPTSCKADSTAGGSANTTVESPEASAPEANAPEQTPEGEGSSAGSNAGAQATPEVEGGSAGTQATEEDNGDDAVCFPHSATVELESGKTITMDKLSVGDRVKVSNGKYSEVYFFTHHDPHFLSYFVEVVAASPSSPSEKHTLMASRAHLIMTQDGLIAANKIQVGDFLYDEWGKRLAVVSTSLVESFGLYSPHTMDGSILVNGIQASTYSNYLPAKIAHMLLLPERISYRLGFSIYGGENYVAGSAKKCGRPIVVEAAYRFVRAIKVPLTTHLEL